jgi:hypothetical protein
MKGSLVWLPLCRTRCHWTDRLLLHFHATSVMMPRAPPTIAPPPILRQNWKTPAQLASRWSKPPDVNTCPHIIFIHWSILSHKPINLLPVGFEAQTKKPSRLFWGPNHQTIDLAFGAQTKKPSRWFWDPNHQTNATGFGAKPENPRFSPLPHVWCGSHKVSPDLPIVRPPSTWLVPDHPRFSTPCLLLLPLSSSLPAMSHSLPSLHRTSKHVFAHRTTQYGLVQPKCAEFKFKLEQVNCSSYM